MLHSYEASELVDNIFLKLWDLFQQGMPTNDIAMAVEALSQIVIVCDDRVGEKSFVLFRKIMDLIKNDSRLWEPARLCMKGAFSAIERAPRVDDLNVILEFLHHHISSQRRSTYGDEPIYHSFRAIINSSDDPSHQRFAGYFTSPLFINTIVEALSNRGRKDLQEVAIILLPMLDTHLFATAFPDPGKAQAFVDAWWAAVENCRTEEPTRVYSAAAQVFFAIVNVPCLRGSIPSNAWKQTEDFEHILDANPPSLQRCTQNPELLPFVAQASPHVGLPSWMTLLWMEHGSLPRDILCQVEEETRKTVYKECEISGTATMCSRTHYCQLWIQVLNTHIKRWNGRLESLGPSDQAVPGLQARLESTERAKKRLIEIRDDVEKDPPPPRWFWEDKK